MVICDCIKITFICLDESTFDFSMTHVGNGVYLGHYDGETYIIYFDGSVWVFANNSTSNIPIFSTTTNSAINPCAINPSDWTPQDLSNFNYCGGNFDTSPILIEDNSLDYPNCGLFSGDCGCKTLVIEEGTANCGIIFQTCDGQLANLELLREITGLTICFSGTPIFINPNGGTNYCGTLVDDTNVECDNYCSTETFCCLNIHAETFDSVTDISNLPPIGVVNGYPFYVFTDVLGRTSTICYLLRGWAIITNGDLRNSSSLRSNDKCPTGEWSPAMVEPDFIYISTEQSICASSPTPTPTPTMTLTPQPYIPEIPKCLQGTNECSVITIFEMDVVCNVINPTTSTSSDGSIFLTITGGTPPYSVTWNNLNVGQAIYNLSGGIYEATVVDYYGDFTAKTTCTVIGPTPTPTPTMTPTASAPVILYDLCVCISNGVTGVVYSHKFQQAGVLNGHPYWSSSTTTSQITWNSGNWYITIPTNFGFTIAQITSATTSIPPISGWQVLGQLGFVSISVGTQGCDSNTKNCNEYSKNHPGLR